MGNLRERYNAKGRQSSLKKSKRRPRNTGQSTENAYETSEPNAAVLIVPKTNEQREADRRERLRLELLEQHSSSKLTSKKKKRLDKYIDKKMKKEERVVLFEKLAKTQAQLSSTLLQPSSTLGSQRPLTNMELLARAEDKATRRAAESLHGRKRRRLDVIEEPSDDESELGGRIGGSPASPIVIPNNEGGDVDPIPHYGEVGSALKRNADGSVRAPVVVKRKSQKASFRRWEKGSNINHDHPADDVESGSSFDSSDSAYDESDDDDDDDAEASTDGRGEGEEEWKGFTNDSEATPSASEGDEDEEETAPPAKRKSGGFKQWALQQLSTAKDYVAPAPSEDVEMETQVLFPLAPSALGIPRAPKEDGAMRGPLGEDLELPKNSLSEQVQKRDAETPVNSLKKFVTTIRPPEVQESRLQLPILAEEQAIVEAIRLNPVVVLCGETGSGKTTQVPQFLYEAGFGSPGSDNPGMIGITQPRRVAAISMAGRVAHELSLPPTVVSYQIRYDATTAPTTVIKFMTDGVLLRELSSDFTLSKYSVVIVDEAHERSVNTDILIGVLSRVIKLREAMWKEGKDGIKPLRLIIMSATLRVSDFVSNTALFNTPPPVIKVDARQYPVTVHFNRRTNPDYIAEAVKKVSKIHARLPPGGILVFLTGQNEITGVCRKLESKYGSKAIEAKKRMRKAVASKRNALTVEEESNDEPLKPQRVAPTLADVEVEEIELGDSRAHGNVEDDDLPGELDAEALDSDEDADDEELGIDKEDSEAPMYILPLYSLLPTEQQMRVFQTPPPGTRLVVVSTNVAETSLTIPGIRYVVDCGRAKERCYDITSGVQSFQVNWISKASVDQRAGRAGRTGPGHCYRLFSSALFEHHFDQFAQPEILKMPIEGVVLQMKSMHIDTVTNFPFPTPPDRLNLRKAERLLIHLGALQSGGLTSSASLDGHITELGKSMSLFPLAPRFAKMLVSGRQHGCLPYIITIVAALSVGDPFLHEEALQLSRDDNESEDDMPGLIGKDADAKERQRSRRRAYFQSQELHSRLGKGSSDVFRLLSVAGAYEYAGGGHKFCDDHFVRVKAMEEIHKLRAQISNIVMTNFPDMETGFGKQMKPPSDIQVKVIKQLVCAAFLDKVAIRKDLVENTALTGKKFTTCRDVPYRALGIRDDAFVHPSSIAFNSSPPDFIVYQEAAQANRLWLKTITVVNAAWLSTLGKSMCTFSKPTKNSAGDLMVIPRFGDEGWELPAVKAQS